METPESVLEFWFSESVRSLWFNSTPEFDARLKDRFESTWRAAMAGELNEWSETPQGAIALVIVLDQFPLNMFRGQPESFASEAKAIEIAHLATDKKFDAGLTDDQKAFLYMPLMHSESMDDQNQSIALYEAARLTDNLKFAQHHRDIVRRFGRFPHRNVILGRESTAEEVAYLESDEAFHG